MILIKKQLKKSQNKDDLESDKSEPDERDQRENKELFKIMETPTKVDDGDLVDTDTDQDTNNEE